MTRAMSAPDPGRTSLTDTITIPTGPIISVVLRGAYAPRWGADDYGRPAFHEDFNHGRVTVFVDGPPDGTVALAATSAAVTGTSVERGDVFLALMSRVAELGDPRRDIATIRLDEIANLRGVRVRHGSGRLLRERLREHVHALAQIRVTIQWKDYQSNRTLRFGADNPDRLFDIVDVQYTENGATEIAYSFRCGQALAYFLTPDGLRWIGMYARALLRLDPYHEALPKKIGTYWLLLAAINAGKVRPARAKPSTILDFCGERPNRSNPNRTVDAFVNAHLRLADVGVLKEPPTTAPPDRARGYFERWLKTPVAVTLTDDLRPGVSRARAPALAPPRRHSEPDIPALPNPEALRADPGLIRRFRVASNLRQAALARALGITRQSLGRYETGARPLPDAVAMDLLDLWRRRTDT